MVKNMWEALFGQVVSAGVTAFWAAVLAICGYILGWIAELITKYVIKKCYYEEFFQRYNIDRAFLGISIRDLAGTLVKWWIFLGFLAQAVALFGLTQITDMFIALYNLYVSVAVGIIYLAIGATIAKYVGDRMRAKRVFGGGITIAGVQGIIMYFALIAALPKFGITDTYILTRAIELFIWAGAVAFGLGVGIALGLGAQDTVKEILSKKKDVIEAILVGTESRGRTKKKG